LLLVEVMVVSGAFPKLIKCKIYAYFSLNLAILDTYKCNLDTEV
jgi:hypothetical protein